MISRERGRPARAAPRAGLRSTGSGSLGLFSGSGQAKALTAPQAKDGLRTEVTELLLEFTSQAHGGEGPFAIHGEAVLLLSRRTVCQSNLRRFFDSHVD